MNAQRKNKRAKRTHPDKRLNREDWVLAAWDILGDGSLEEIKVKRLAAKLGATRGSFYWHFKNRQELIEALVDRWFAVLGVREATMRDLEGMSDPKKKLWTVMQNVILRINAGQSVALRLYTHRDQKLRQRIKSEDNRRDEHFAELFQDLGNTKAQAQKLGSIYRAVVMSEYLRNGALSREERLAEAKKMHNTLVQM